MFSSIKSLGHRFADQYASPCKASLTWRAALGPLARGAVLALACTASLAWAQAAMPPDAKRPQDFPHAKLTIGLYVIDAGVAANNKDREQGLMYRTGLAPNEGMLFVFDEDAGHCFWMENTLIPLSIAFMRQDGTITDIDEMQAETTNNHCPAHNGTYALEMSKGWFAAKGITSGTVVSGLPPPG